LKRLLFVSFAALVLSGCATQNQTIYQWGGYDELLYQSYKSPDRVEAMRVGLEALLVKLDTQKQKPPPGLYAELGTLYLQLGDDKKALTNYELERRNWPESKTLMDSLIKTLESRNKTAAAEGAAK
jgi:hypothetical protein